MEWSPEEIGARLRIEGYAHASIILLIVSKLNLTLSLCTRCAQA